MEWYCKGTGSYVDLLNMKLQVFAGRSGKSAIVMTLVIVAVGGKYLTAICAYAYIYRRFQEVVVPLFRGIAI